MKALRLFVYFVLLPLFLNAQTFFTQQLNYKFFPASSGALRNGLNGFDNPALLTYVEKFDSYFLWNTQNNTPWKIKNNGIFLALKKIGFGYYSLDISNLGKINIYKISSAFGDKSSSFGLSYQWIKSNIRSIDYKDVITLSSLFRPNKHLSLGLVASFDSKMSDYESVIDFGVRPFGNEKLTLFGDYRYSRIMNSKYSNWSAGLVVEPLKGIQFIGRTIDFNQFNLGVQISLGNASFLHISSLSAKFETLDQVYGIRIGSYDRNIISNYMKKEESHNIDLNGTIKYQKPQLFAKSRTLIELFDELDLMKNDPHIKTIEINTSGINTSKVFLWELRNKLMELKNSGKKIVIYIDNANIDLYHFASAADKIVMDPMGVLILEGIIAGRNYYKGTLEKLGIGFDELRFFKYKSAAETFARDKMSDADREQRQLIIDNLYNSYVNDIETTRPSIKIKLDSLINNYVVFTSNEAMKYGLIDSIGRWYDLKDKSITRGAIKVFKQDLIDKTTDNDTYWGEKPKIAVIYGFGACAMDEGIKARSLVKDFEKVEKDKSIKAVVFRVDSPGGDALASDVIAEAIKKVKMKKPVIISQGYVAGSGGYWLSMYGDTIVSNENTITGSIGVIGSWFYNKNFKEKLGVSTDYVKRGDHADLDFGFLIPILNIPIPDRKLSNEERNRLEELIKSMYSVFVNRVADGRKKSSDEIEKVAQGRVWSGKDAVKLGLVDVIGGLEDAIEIARKKANLNENEYQIVEFPKPPLFELDFGLPFQFSTNSNTKLQSTFDFLLFRMKYNGKPLLMMPMDELYYENNPLNVTN